MRERRLVYLFFLTLLVSIAAAQLEVTFPFASQVPNLARVGVAYSYQLAATTFGGHDDANLSYALVDPPAWLNIDSQSGILYGMPGQGDKGVNIFSIAASDFGDSTSMACTLMVTTNFLPQVAGNISEVLSRAGALAGPTTLYIALDDSFEIAFGKSFFQAGSEQIKIYYATLVDHTPLPSWLEFDDTSLTFWGLSPQLSSGSQTWTINLIASDIVGFAGVTATFALTVTNRELVFTPQHQELVATTGSFFSYTSLLDGLFLDGQSLSRSQIFSVTSHTPPWLKLHNDTLSLDGIPPEASQSKDFEIVVTDIYGGIATKSIHLLVRNAKLFTKELENTTATAGKPFNYSISQSISNTTNHSITVEFGTSSWLHYDHDSMQLKGMPPLDARPQVILVTIMVEATTVSQKESQTFALRVQAAPLDDVPTATSSISTTSYISTSPSMATPLGTATRNNMSTKKSVTAGVAVAIVIGCLALCALLSAVAMLLCHRNSRDANSKTGKPKISKPFGTTSTPVGLLTEEAGRLSGVEDATNIHDRAPRFDLPVYPTTQRTPQVRYSRSLTSSLGNGDVAIQSDPNIPIWGRGSDATHHPHHSYAAATELARNNSQASQTHLSPFTRVSPRKRTSKLLRSWQPLPRHDTASASLYGSVLRPSRRRTMVKSGLSVTPRSSSEASSNTHGTSMLSAKIHDFPEPPTSMEDGPCSVTPLKIRKMNNRQSIRLVSRSDSVATDRRSLAEKRQSFIRNRASSSMVSPLFASSRRVSNMRAEDSLGGSNHGSLHYNQSQRSIFSAASSLEPQPPARNPQRLASGTCSSAQSFLHPNSALPSRLPSPHRTIPEENGSYGYTTATVTPTTNSSITNMEETRDADAAAFVAQLALPRNKRSWVLPGEASPTPPSSSAIRSRDSAHRRWRERLERDSRGAPMSRPETPVKLTDVAQDLKRLRSQSGRAGVEGWGSRGADRLSLLVSKDSINGPMRRRAERDEVDTAVEDSHTAAGAQGNDSEWEDVTSERTSGVPSHVDTCESESDRLRSSCSGKAFI